MNIDININYVVCVVFSLLIWFKTDAILEYSRLFNVNILHSKDFDKAKSEDFELTYISFLRKKDTFFYKLITCPICLASWEFIPFLGYTLSIQSYCFNVLIALYLYYLLIKLKG